MTKQKSQIRFVFEFDGELRRILSIHEGANDDLFVVTHAHGLLDILEDGSAKPIKEFRHAVHVSPQSGSNLIHRVTVHDDGTQHDLYLATNALRDGRLQPIYVRQVARPQVLPILQLPAKGEVVTLPSYDPSGCSMFYAVWLASRDVGEAFNLPAPFTIETRVFRYFSILLAYCYTERPSRDHAAHKEYVTETEEKRSAKHEELRLQTGPAEGSIPLSVIPAMIRDFNQIIVARPRPVGLKPDSGPLNLVQIPRFFSNPVVWK